jgi:hypothetical protein
MAFADSSPIAARSQAAYVACTWVPARSMGAAPDLAAFATMALIAVSSISTASPVRGEAAASLQAVAASALVADGGVAEAGAGDAAGVVVDVAGGAAADSGPAASQAETDIRTIIAVRIGACRMRER